MKTLLSLLLYGLVAIIGCCCVIICLWQFSELVAKQTGQQDFNSAQVRIEAQSNY